MRRRQKERVFEASASGKETQEEGTRGIGSREFHDPWQVGMSDLQLEEKCVPGRFSKGLSPWAYWESERTGFGRQFRRRAFYPSILPLMLSSDHYVDPLVTLRDNEVDSQAKAYLTWNYTKMQRLRKAGVAAYHVKHPWSSLLLRWSECLPLCNRRGTLVFWPHSNDLVMPEMQLERFVAALHQLGDEYEPFAICLTSHDVEKGVHKSLRQFGLPITTAGALTSQSFPEVFLGLISRFRYTAGPGLGSHVYYALALGIPFRLVDPTSFRYRSVGKDGAPGQVYDDLSEDYPDPVDREIIDDLMDSLKSPYEDVPMHLREFASHQLGESAGMSRARFSILAWSVLLRSPIQVLRLYLRPLKEKLIGVARA